MSPSIPSTSWFWPWSPGRGWEKVPRRSSTRSEARLDGQPPELFTSDEHAPYETAIGATFSEAVPQPQGRPGRPRVLPQRRPVPGLRYATVRKQRAKGRVVSVDRRVVVGCLEDVEQVLKDSVCSRTINTSFVERQHATDRGRNAAQVAADISVQQGLGGSRVDDLLHDVPCTTSAGRCGPCGREERTGDGSRGRQRWRRVSPTMSGRWTSG